ncbi:MAG: hypothetical protein [Bacteriophage sp.]|jgi:hypothetical protein|nr:MAG: hypothetical protein [Bacteriophage sp.]UWI04939.1 MAG: hypothetical protein [Bacteriophage sp.]UWI14902.1 MAG: hypothetical protein [Bacteriophage sp.]
MKKGIMTIDCAQCPHQGNGCPGFNDCIIYKNIWEQRRWEAAKDAMKGILSNEDLTTRIEEGAEYMLEGIAKEAVLLADALIKEFQKP